MCTSARNRSESVTCISYCIFYWEKSAELTVYESDSRRFEMILVSPKNYLRVGESFQVSQFQGETERGELEILRTRNKYEIQNRDMNCSQDS